MKIRAFILMFVCKIVMNKTIKQIKKMENNIELIIIIFQIGKIPKITVDNFVINK